jgi:predicted permease
MHQFSFLLFNVLTPIFLQVAAGFLIQKRFTLDIGSLGKVQFYVLIPALVFGSIYRTPLEGGQVMNILLCNLGVFVALVICARIVSRLLKLDPLRRMGLDNASGLYNSGNYCIPLIQLLYSTPFSYSIQIIVLLLQSALTNTFGVINTPLQKKSIGNMLLSLLRMPTTWAMIAAVAFRIGDWTLWKPMETSLDSLALGLVPLALMTLGAQLANSCLKRPSMPVCVATLLRLLGGPLAAWAMVSALGIHGVAGQVIVICAGAPAAVNTVVLAIEFKGDAEFASQTVMLSTLLSAISMPLVISAALALI